MLRAGVRVCCGLRWGAVGITSLLVLSAISNDAEARGRLNRLRAAFASYQPSYSSIVVDGNSGKVLQSTNADSTRHPASLTKIMTLYLLFERLESGKIKLGTEMPVSAHAASQAPSKLGLKPGETIRVETAIRAIVTKSANDVAVIVSEALGGDEPNFAKLMTAKARALGMKGTTYRNASGLPDDDQITSWEMLRAWTALRLATSTIQGLTSSPRFAAPIATSWLSCLAVAPPTNATPASAA